MTKRKQKPPRLRDLIELLNQVEVRLLKEVDSLSADKSAQQAKKKVITQVELSLEEINFSELNLDSDEDWVTMLDEEKW